MKKIIFSGTSITQGLGLEIELHPRFSNIDWLKENGVFPPILGDLKYADEDYEIIKKHRWTKLVSDELGYEEFNCFDYGRKGWPTGPINFLRFLSTKSEEEFSDVSHIVLQVCHLRYNPIDGVSNIDSLYLGMTPSEMISVIENPKESDSIKEKIYDWIANYDEIKEIRNFSIQIDNLKKKFPKIKFHILFWNKFDTNITKENLIEIWDDLCWLEYNGIKKLSIDDLKIECKLGVSDSAFCYTNNKNVFGFKIWKEREPKDAHLSKLGHQVLAENVIKKIKSSI